MKHTLISFNKPRYPLLTLFGLLLYSSCTAQSQAEKSSLIGLDISQTTLTDVHHYEKSQLSLNEFKGKWLVLDFWNQSCIGCIASFPETNNLQMKYSGKVQFLLVGYTGSQYRGRPDLKTIPDLYERLRTKLGLNLPIVYDSLLFTRFRISGCPTLIIVDPYGKINGIRKSINGSEISSLLSGASLVISKKVSPVLSTSDSYDSTIPFLTGENGGSDTDFVYRSIIAKCNDDIPNQLGPDTFASKTRLEILKAGLDGLYRYAYVGRQYWDYYGDSLYSSIAYKPILEVKDQSLFDYYENKYCYSLILDHPENKQFFMEALKDDLRKYFGFSVRIERKLMPCWELVAGDSAHVKLKVGKDSLDQEDYHARQTFLRYSVKNAPISSFLQSLASRNTLTQGNYPIFDETGIKENVNISINALMTDMRAVGRELKKYDLDLIKGEKEMQVIVISDGR